MPALIRDPAATVTLPVLDPSLVSAGYGQRGAGGVDVEKAISTTSAAIVAVPESTVMLPPAAMAKLLGPAIVTPDPISINWNSVPVGRSSCSAPRAQRTASA